MATAAPSLKSRIPLNLAHSSRHSTPPEQCSTELTRRSHPPSRSRVLAHAQHSRSSALERRPVSQPADPSRPQARSGDTLVARAKFQTFERPDAPADPSTSSAAEAEAESGERPDEVLPGDLPSAIKQAGTAAAAFCNAGGTRALVELLVPEMEVVAEDGAQQRVWDASRQFLEALKGEVNFENVRAVFPDAGAAALLRYKWGADIPFAVSSLNDRKPVAEEDELVVLVSPDWQLLEKVQSIANSLASEDGLTRPLILWNPRLSSGDVGIGLNVRRMRDFFLGSFTTVYFMRPLGVGAIFRHYPSAWNLFLDDEDVPGRYTLYRQQGSKPNGDDIEEMYLAAAGKGEEGDGEPGFFAQLGSTLSSLSRFMNSLSK